jgi:hypothetical protein
VDLNSIRFQSATSSPLSTRPMMVCCASALAVPESIVSAARILSTAARCIPPRAHLRKSDNHGNVVQDLQHV